MGASEIARSARPRRCECARARRAGGRPSWTRRRSRLRVDRYLLLTRSQARYSCSSAQLELARHVEVFRVDIKGREQAWGGAALAVGGVAADGSRRSAPWRSILGKHAGRVVGEARGTALLLPYEARPRPECRAAERWPVLPHFRRTYARSAMPWPAIIWLSVIAGADLLRRRGLLLVEDDTRRGGTSPSRARFRAGAGGHPWPSRASMSERPMLIEREIERYERAGDASTAAHGARRERAEVALGRHWMTRSIASGDDLLGKTFSALRSWRSSVARCKGNPRERLAVLCRPQSSSGGGCQLELCRPALYVNV